VSFSLFILCYYAPVLVVNLCFYFFVFIPALVLPFYSINYVCIILSSSPVWSTRFGFISLCLDYFVRVSLFS